MIQLASLTVWNHEYWLFSLFSGLGLWCLYLRSSVSVQRKSVWTTLNVRVATHLMHLISRHVSRWPRGPAAQVTSMKFQRASLSHEEYVSPPHVSQDLWRRSWMFLWIWMWMWYEEWVEDSLIRAVCRPGLCSSPSCWILGPPVLTSPSSCWYVWSITNSASRSSFGLTVNVVFVSALCCRLSISSEDTNEFLTNWDVVWKLCGCSWRPQQDGGECWGESTNIRFYSAIQCKPTLKYLRFFSFIV